MQNANPSDDKKFFPSRTGPHPGITGFVQGSAAAALNTSARTWSPLPVQIVIGLQFHNLEVNGVIGEFGANHGGQFCACKPDIPQGKSVKSSCLSALVL